MKAIIPTIVTVAFGCLLLAASVEKPAAPPLWSVVTDGHGYWSVTTNGFVSPWAIYMDEQDAMFVANNYNQHIRTNWLADTNAVFTNGVWQPKRGVYLLR